jgi:hypothetical protein
MILKKIHKFVMAEIKTYIFHLMLFHCVTMNSFEIDNISIIMCVIILIQIHQNLIVKLIISKIWNRYWRNFNTCVITFATPPHHYCMSSVLN